MSRPLRFIPEDVARGDEWPGISMIKAVLDGEPVRGTWFNRTQEYRARLRKKKDFDPRSFASEEAVVLSQLPGKTRGRELLPRLLPRT